MKISEITDYLESLIPLSFQESYDNSGLLVGDRNAEAKGALICIDVTEEVVDETIQLGFNLIISHHPLVFSGLKKFTGSNAVQRTLLKAIKNDVAIYSAHTNLDKVAGFGVNFKIAQKLGLQNVEVLAPETDLYSKIAVNVPVSYDQGIANEMFAVGAGRLGNYTNSALFTSGTETFKPNFIAEPFLGEREKVQYVESTKIEAIALNQDVNRVVDAIKKAHPYEQPAIDVIALKNQWNNVGCGAVGNLPKPQDAEQFLKKVKEVFGCGVIKHTQLPNKPISRVALCGGSGSEFLHNAIASGADIYITADVKYHQFFDAPYPFVLADIGHYESEQFTKEIFSEILTEKFNTFALQLTKVNTNPIKYL